MRLAKIILILTLLFTPDLFSQEEPFVKNLTSLQFIEGSFSTLVSFPNSNGAWQKPVESKFKFQKIMNNMYIEGNGLIPFDSTFSTNFRMIFDFDSLNNVYRLVALDDSFGFMDIYYGHWNGDQLVLTNEKTGTQVLNEGNRVYGKLIITKSKNSGFIITALVSQDNIKTWQNYMKLEFSQI